jgi:hypothetical protein
MVAEPRRSGFVTWVLIGLVVILVLGTAGAVALPVFRCQNCRPTPGEPSKRRVRIDNRFVATDRPCDWCNNRAKMTGLSSVIYAVQRSRR